jgi:short-subunit dehydrogenase
MENKTITVTGANRRLGRALIEVALEYSPKKIYAAFKDMSFKEEIENINPIIEVVELDITDEDVVQKFYDKTKYTDILINNAGVNSNCRIFTKKTNDLEVNFHGTVKVCKQFFEDAKKRKIKIVNVSSVAALINMPLIADYSISKAALHSFTQCLRAELALYGSEVYEVFPGPINTRLTEGLPILKAEPKDVAKAIYESIKKKEEDIFPDDFAKSLRDRLIQDPKSVEKELAKSLT